MFAKNQHYGDDLGILLLLHEWRDIDIERAMYRDDFSVLSTKPRPTVISMVVWYVMPRGSVTKRQICRGL